jgi:glycerol uptake facilitator-like aquaporin
MDQKLRMYLAELLGTFLLVLFGAGAVCAAFLPADSRINTAGSMALAAALAEGCALAVALSATFYLSNGCLNPAITLALWVLKRLDGPRAMGLIVAQLLGAALAGLALRSLFSTEVLADAQMGTPHLRALLGSPEGSVTLAALGTGALLEFAFTFLVTVAVFATLIDPRGPKVGGAIVGMAQIAVVLVGFHLTGGSANPARWFGTAVWQPTVERLAAGRPFADHLPYWVGPILGALAGGIFYTAVVLPPAKK